MRQKKNLRVEPARVLGKSTLAVALAVALAFSVIIGITAGAMGLGSLYPQLNLIAKPFVCPAGQMSYSKQVSQIGTANYHTAKWFCTDARSGAVIELNANTIFASAGVVYALLIFALLLLITYLYWHSPIGPARNGGPRLW